MKEWSWVIVIALGILGIRLYVFAPYTIHGDSMEPNFHSGDRIITNELTKGDLHYGDVVVIHHEYEPDREYLIKRVIGLPGDAIEVKDGVTYRNGKPAAEPFIKETMTEDADPLLVPPGHVFVMGDNRNNSLDSRILGSIQQDEVVGTYSFRFWPLS